MDDDGDVPPKVPYGTHIWHLPTITTLKMSSMDRIQQLFRAPKLLDYATFWPITLLQLKELMLHSPLLQKVNIDELADNEKGEKFHDDEHAEKEWKQTELDWFHELIVSHTINNSGADGETRSYTSVWPSLTEFQLRGYTPLSILQITVLPIVNQLREVIYNLFKSNNGLFLTRSFAVVCMCTYADSQIDIECSQLCVDHVATLLYNNASTLEEFICCHGAGPADGLIPSSDGSFTRWSLIDKPRSLILPQCEFFTVEIGSLLLINALYLPSCKHIGLLGTAVVQPLPNLHDIAPISTSIELDLGYYFKDVIPYKNQQDDEEKKEKEKRVHLSDTNDDEDDVKADASTKENKLDVGGHDRDDHRVKEQAPLLSPCPLPSSSILDNTFVDNIIAVISPPPTTTSTSIFVCEGKQNWQPFDSISIRTGNGYMTLSQVQRLSDSIIKNTSCKHSASWRRLALRSSQPLIFDNLNTSNATSVSLTGSSSHLKVNDDYMINSIFELIVKMSRWILPRSYRATINLPRLLISSQQQKVLQHRCINTFGSLLTGPHAQLSPLAISFGDLDLELQRPIDEEE
jgi:hypothetical protein